jgi:hypothetical protein
MNVMKGRCILNAGHETAKSGVCADSLLEAEIQHSPPFVVRFNAQLCED